MARFQQITINYPSGPRRVKLSDKKTASIVKYMALGLPKLAMAALLGTCTDFTKAKKLLFKKMEEEMMDLTSTKEPSVLRQTRHDLLPYFKLADFVAELKAKAPLTTELLYTLCVSKAKKHKQEDGEQVDTAIATIAATMLQKRCVEMSALAYRIGLILRFSGAGQMVSMVIVNNIIPFTEVPPLGGPFNCW